MKKLFTPLCLLVLNLAQGQYFQQRFNLDYATPNLRNERCNSGIRTRVNYAGGNPALHYFAGIGTSYNNTALPAPNNVADRMRFKQLNNLGTAVISNFGYQFADPGTPWFHSYGNSIAEVKNTSNNGGYVTVGAVTNNTITGAGGIVGNSDALFTQLSPGGAVISAVRYDINGGTDQAWCIRSSAIIVNGLPTWILCGQSKRGANNTDCFVARVFANGTIVWFNRYNFDPGGGNFNTAHNIAKQLCEDSTGYIYVVGTLQDAPAGAAGIDGLAFKLTPAGGVVWVNNYNISPDDEFQSVRLSFDGNIVTGGFTNFGAVAPATHNMLITKLAALNGAVLFQNALRASIGAANYTSKCYDIIETAGPQYFLAGPLTKGAANYEMMYKTGAGGIGINWYLYNRMNYNAGFGIDNVNTAANPGVAYFSSMRNPSNAAFSDSHIMKTDYTGRTCGFCGANLPINVPLQLQVYQRKWLQVPTGQLRQLVNQIFTYNNILICNQSVVICPAPAITAAEPGESDASVVTKPVSLKVFPNPVKNTLHVQLSSLPAGSYQISVANTEGRMVLQRNNIYYSGTSSTDLDISSFTPGIYILTVRHGELVLQQKIMKE